MGSKKLFVKKNTLYIFILYLVLLPILYFFINFDSSKNLDYGGYKDNYENLWNQFELGYTALENISRFFTIKFDFFWHILICIELILIAILYTNPYVFLLAFPNLLFLSQGLLGTQIRFAIAVLLCLVVFKFFFEKKRFFFYSIGASLFHNGTLIFIFLSFFMKIRLNFKKGILDSNNFKNLFCLIIFLFALSLLVNYILLVMGYYYYADAGSKHMVNRSFSSLIYIGILLFFVFILLKSKYQVFKYAEFVYLGGIMLILSLIFYKYSIISGRYNLVFMLIEPFFLYSYFKTIGNKSSSGFVSFLFLFFVTNLKLLQLNLIV